MTKKKENPKSREKQSSSKDCRQEIAELVLKPEFANNKAMLWLQEEPDEVPQLIELQKQCKEISSGDMSQPESMLWGQAQLLNHISSRFARRMMQGDMSVEVLEALSNIMLRSQNQTRRTLDSLANLKRPRVQVQHNQAMLQQVVNETPTEKNAANKLLEVNHESRLDTGTPQEAVRSDRPLEAMGEVHGAKDTKR